MLTKNAISAAVSVTETFSNAGCYIDVKAGTPLRLMVDQCMCPTALCDELSVEQTAEALSTNSSIKNAADIYPHDVATEQTVEIASKALMNNISYARHVVNPLIEKMVESIKAKEAERDARFAYGFNVIPFDYAEFWDQVGLVAIAEKYSEMAAEPVKFIEGMAPLSGDELRTLLETGANSVGKSVLAYVDKMTSVDYNYLETLYNDVFLSGTPTKLTATFLAPGPEVGSVVLLPTQIGANHIAVVHFLAKALVKTIPDSFSVDAKAYELAMSTLVGQTGRRLSTVIEQRRRDNGTGRLIYTIEEKAADGSKSRTDIVVNGDVYPKYLKDGGSVEAVIGNALTDKVLNVDEIVSGTDRYLAAQQTYARTMIERDNADYHARTISFMRTALHEALGSLEDGQCTRTRGDAVNEIAEHLGYVTQADLENLWVVSRKLICHCFFYGTNVLSILTYMDDLAKRMPRADGRLLSYYAAIEVMADWVSDSLMVVYP